jgi:uncharacterized membrane protein YGL010W
MGLVMLVFSASCYALALQLVGLESPSAWLGSSMAVFVFGWVLQFIGEVKSYVAHVRRSEQGIA